MGVTRLVLGYVAALVATDIFASVFHTQMVLAALAGAGGIFEMGTRLGMTAFDLRGLAFSYGVIIAIALAIGFAVAWVVKKFLPPLAPIAYPTAGAAAMGVALSIMSMAFGGTTPIAGARGPEGFALQCLAGALGGVIFAWIVKRRGEEA